MSEKPRLSYSDDSADDIDVPRVERDIYRMAGRAAPQRIEPRAPEASPAAPADAAESKPSSKVQPSAEAESELQPEVTSESKTGAKTAAEVKAADAAKPAEKNTDAVAASSTAKGTDTASPTSVPSPKAAEQTVGMVEQPQSEAPIQGSRRASAPSPAAEESSERTENQSAPTEVFAHSHLASAPTAGAGEPGRAYEYSEPLHEPDHAPETTVLPRSEVPLNSGELENDDVVVSGTHDDTAQADSRPSATDYAREAPRGTIDFGILLLRLTLAAVFLYDGLVTLFGVGGSGGVDGLESSLVGIQAAGALAWAIPIVEVLAGVLIILGVIGPLGVALGLAVSSFLTLHTLGAQPADVAFTALPVSTKYWGLAALATVAINFMGPGRLSFDRGRSWAHRPVISGFIGVIVGLALGAGGWFLLGGSLPAFV